jgi:hypothetical protein
MGEFQKIWIEVVSLQEVEDFIGYIFPTDPVKWIHFLLHERDCMTLFDQKQGGNQACKPSAHDQHLLFTLYQCL